MGLSARPVTNTSMRRVLKYLSIGVVLIIAAGSAYGVKGYLDAVS